MNIFPWTPDYSIGVFRLDEQHQDMLVLYNQLFESLLQGTNTQSIESYIVELQKTSEIHFRTEEQAMEDTDYPEIADHKAQHADFIANMERFKKRAQEAAGTLELYDLSRELSQCLKDWIHQHICVVDKKLGRHLNRRGIH